MRKIHLIGTSLLAVTMAHPAYAQVAPKSAEAPVAEPDDIIVTATKREQTLQDVPISVSVTGSETVERAQIRDLIDLQSVVPSLKVSQLNAVGQTNFIIRGFGNGNGNDGIESSVGVFVDGVYRSRSAAALDDLPEIERIEVLRGPQSTLFGKNVSAGAISIVTKKPQFDFGAKAEISLGNYGQMLAKASITGPITDTIAVRVSGSINERQGYFNNLTTGNKVNDRNRWSIRGDLLWQPSADFSFRIIADYNLIKEVCCGVSSIFNGLNGQPYPTQQVTIAGGVRVSPTNFIGTPVALGGLGKAISDPTRVFDRNVIFNSDPTNRVRGEGISGQADWNIGFAKLTSITAYRNQVNQSQQDIDFTAADVATNTTANEIRTFTQEIRLASNGDGPLNWLIGGFYQDEKTDTGREIRYGKDARAYLNGLTGGLLPLLEGLQAASGNPGHNYFAPGQGISDNYKLKQRAYSIFGQVDFKVTDRLTLTGGAAYLNDRKEVRSNVVMNDQFSALNLEKISNIGFLPYAALPAFIQGCLAQKGFTSVSAGGRVPVNLFGSSLGQSPFFLAPGGAPCPTSPKNVNPFALTTAQLFYGDATGDPNLIHGPVNIPNASETGIFSGDKVTYTARAAYDFGAVNAYISYSKGWKASAVNLSSDSRPPNVNGVGRFAAPENVTVYEAGLKAKFRGGYFNLAVFKESIKGFQSNGFTGTGYALVNAGEESVRGFEVDAAYRATPWLALTGAVTYLDPKYDSFPGAPCFTFDTVRCPINPATGKTPPQGRDLTGDKPAGVPTWSASASATFSHDFGDGLSAFLRGEYDYTSDTYLTETTPASLATWGLSQVNASVSVVDTNAQLEVTFWGRNITNDNSLIATFSTVAQDGSFSGYPNQPRTYGVTIRKTF